MLTKKNKGTRILLKSTITDQSGYYALEGFDFDSLYRPFDKITLEAEDIDNDPTLGVSTLDLVILHKHILGVKKIENHLGLLAADIKNSKVGDISSIDLVILQKIILGIETKFPNNKSWRFMPESLKNSFRITQMTPFNFTLVNRGDQEINFIGIKTGDVSGH